jgi:hypothetical protein
MSNEEQQQAQSSENIDNIANFDNINIDTEPPPIVNALVTPNPASIRGHICCHLEMTSGERR